MIPERHEFPTAGGRALVLTPSREPAVDRALLEAIAGERPHERSVLAVTYGRTAESFVEAWREHVGVRPRNLGVVDVNGVTRAASATRAPESGVRNVVASVTAPDDPLAVLDAAEVFLDEWDDDEPIVYLDSLTGLLQRVGMTRSIGFVDALDEWLESRECTGYVRLEKHSHDGWVGTVLGPRFDSVLDLAVDGEAWSWTTPPVTTNGDESVEEDTVQPPLDRVFDILGNRDRRLVLHALRQAARPLQVSEVAERVVAMKRADSDREVADEALERTYVGLRHIHVPKLEQADMISVGPDDTVQLREASRRVDSFLILTVAEDLDV